MHWRGVTRNSLAIAPESLAPSYLSASYHRAEEAVKQMRWKSVQSRLRTVENAFGLLGQSRIWAAVLRVWETRIISRGGIQPMMLSLGEAVERLRFFLRGGRSRLGAVLRDTVLRCSSAAPRSEAARGKPSQFH